MHKKNYCCYRHFSSGKEGQQCTYCYSHVPLGVINPQHQRGRQIVPPSHENMGVLANTFRIARRTHDYNEIQNKQSKPERLTSPKLYIEEIGTKGKSRSILLPVRHTGSQDYQRTVQLYGKLAECLTIKQKRTLQQIFKNYAMDNKISNLDNLFLTKNQFCECMMNNFPTFNLKQCEQFWQISYNSLRFHEKISINAFVFNFQRFYLRLQDYKNTLSQSSLKQRAIDLRLVLFDWFHNFSYLQQNLKQCRKLIQTDLLLHPQIQDDDELVCDLKIMLQTNLQICWEIKCLAQTFFPITDNKFITLDLVKKLITDKISSMSQILDISRNVMKNFLQYKQKTPFAITQILQFCSISHQSKLTIDCMIFWLRNLLEYFHFYKMDKMDGIEFNPESKKIQCDKIIHIDCFVVEQYDLFLEAMFDAQVNVLSELNAMLDASIQRMPFLEGHKKQILQCNYVIETILRFIQGLIKGNGNGQQGYRSIVQVWLIWRRWGYGQNVDGVKDVVKGKMGVEELKKNVKEIFAKPVRGQEGQELGQSGVSYYQQREIPDVQLALNGYKIAKEKGKIVVQDPQKQKIDKQINELFQYPSKKSSQQPQNNHSLPQTNQNPPPSQTNPIPSPSTPQKPPSPSTNQLPSPSPSTQFLNLSKYPSPCSISKQTTESISTVEALQQTLLQLLDFNY